MRRLLTADLPRLLRALEEEGYRLVGPAVEEGALVLREIRELPRGLIDHHGPGRYRLEQTDSGRYFDYTLGQDSFKRFLHPPEDPLFRTRREGDRLVFEPALAPERPLALIAARPCDLAALRILDRVLLEQDELYRDRRRGLFVLAVQCGRAGELCFCTSTDSGPHAARGFDLALTELDEAFLVEVGTARGRALLARVQTTDPDPFLLAAASARWRRAAESIQRRFPAEPTRQALAEQPEHPRFKQVAERCLSCANCTMVCPTCFCTSPLERDASRVRVWDSCFSLDYSAMHGSGPVRSSLRARYRQWLTHKLSSWHDQFGTPGCVGCGRCVAWCPAEIDLLEEARAIRESPQ